MQSSVIYFNQPINKIGKSPSLLHIHQNDVWAYKREFTTDGNCLFLRVLVFSAVTRILNEEELFGWRFAPIKLIYAVWSFSAHHTLGLWVHE